MRNILSLLFFCLIFQNVLLAKLSKYQMTKIGMFLNQVKKINERKLRKLEGTDSTEDTAEPTLPEQGNFTKPTPGQAESGDATAANGDATGALVSTKSKGKGNKKAAIQFSKFYGFHSPSGIGPFYFNVLFYLIRIVPKWIIFRLRITYNSRLRNLDLGDAGTAESARSDCTPEDNGMVGDDATGGKSVKFACNATSAGNINNAKVEVNTDVDMTIVEANGTTTKVGFEDVNFNGDAAEDAENLGAATDIFEGFYTLSNSKSSVEGNYLVIKGTFSDLRRLDISNGATINMGIPNHKDNDEITTDSIPCTYESSSLRCDASNTKIVTSDQDLHLSSGKTADNKTLLQIEMSDLTNSTTFPVGGSSSGGYHTKSSSGLSGGAIAGIVIACVVVLVAATVAAVMLRKPTPPMENTTVVDLKTDNL